jgi:large subunit ribosomal protein L21
MYAIVEIAGKQFRVAKDMKLKVPRLQSEAGEKVQFDKVLLMEDDKGNVEIGKPVLDARQVSVTVLEHGRDKKIIVFKKKRRKGHEKKNGHRQGFSMIQVNEIGGAKKATKARSKKAAEETAAPAEAKEE